MTLNSMKNLTPILLIIISVAIFFVFIDPQYSKVKELLIQSEENKTMLELAAELSAKRDQLHEEYRNIDPSDKEDLLKLLPETVDNVRLILDINNIAESFGVVITNINVSGGPGAEGQNAPPVAPGPSESVGTISLSFSVNAPYELFIELLRDLEESLRVVDVRNLTISTGNQQNAAAGDDTVFYNFGITLDTYWLR